MNFPCFRAISLSFVSFVATAVCVVAQQLPEKEEDIPVEFIPRLDNTVSIGVHHLTRGPKVRFGNLGMIGQAATQNATTFETVNRAYSNGTVTQDSRTAYETDMTGGQLIGTLETAGFISKVNGQIVTVYTPVSIAQTDASGTPMVNATDGSYIPVSTSVTYFLPDGSTSTGEVSNLYWATTSMFRAYDKSRTRNWSIQGKSQVDAVNHTVSMSAYGTTSAGASVEADSAGSTGFELSLEHRMGQRGHFEWGVSAGFKFVGINAKAYADVPAYLTAQTDVYKMVPNSDGSYSIPSNFTSGSSYGPGNDAANLYLKDLNGNTLTDDAGKMAYYFSNSTVTPTLYVLGADLSAITTLDVTNIAFGKIQRDSANRIVNVHGFWQLKGAYYMARVGPTFRYRFNDTFAISGSFGLAEGWVGTTFRADEYFDDTLDVYTPAGVLAPVPESVANAQVYRSKEENVTHKFVPGCYGEVNLEYWVTERTGFYFGMSKQSMREFSQRPLSGRSARVDLGTSSGWKFGVMTRF